MKERIGILLAAGCQVKRTSFRVSSSERFVGSRDEVIKKDRAIEPDLDGKVRALAVLQDLAVGKIDKIWVSGGAQADKMLSAQEEFPTLASVYTSYLKRIASIHGLQPFQICEVKGGVNTATDLEKTHKKLEEERFRGDVGIYSMSYHLRRRPVGNFTKMFKRGKVYLEPAELKILERNPRYATSGVLDRILTQEHLTEVHEAMKWSDRLPQFLSNFIVYVLRDPRVVKLKGNVRNLLKINHERSDG